ncbi:hypothetical protein JCM5350_001151 [Sporobolomyces pararoseus]
MTFPASAQSSRKPLSAAQESRLIRHLDPALLSLSGSFESRHSPHSQLPTLSSFLDAVIPLLSLVLAIPAAKPSGGLRVAYLLQLTGYLSPAIEGYPLNDESIEKLFVFIEKFDRGWATVLEGKEWDSANGKEKEKDVEGEQPIEGEGYEVQPLRNTDLVRIKSLIQDLRQVLSSSLNLPEMVPLSINPFEQNLGVDVRRRFGLEAEEIERTPELSMGEEIGDETTTEDEAMSIDTTHTLAPEEEEEDDEDDQFEQVEIASPSSSRLPSAYPHAIDDDSYISPSSDPEDSPAAFEIHFTGPPPPTLTDGEITINSGQTPIVGQSRGFDPDEEYPVEDDEEEERQAGEEGLISKREIREKVKKVFEETGEILERLGTQREGQ